MSVSVWRNNFSKIYFSTFYYLPSNTKLLIRSGTLTNISKGILTRQFPSNGTRSGTINNISKRIITIQFPSNSVLRRCSSALIKHYKSNRKYAATWKLERLLGWSMIILIPTAFTIDSNELEMALCAVALLHTYWGCQSVCSDYLRSNIVGKLVPIVVRFFAVFLFLSSITGAYQLVYEDVGLINMIKKFWSIRGKDYTPPMHMQRVERKQNMFFKK